MSSWGARGVQGSGRGMGELVVTYDRRGGGGWVGCV